jgi:hypothetical protein
LIQIEVSGRNQAIYYNIKFEKEELRVEPSGIKGQLNREQEEHRAILQEVNEKEAFLATLTREANGRRRNLSSRRG